MSNNVKPTATKTEVVSFRLSEAERNAFQVKCQPDGRTLSSFLRQAVIEFIDDDSEGKPSKNASTSSETR